MLPAVLLLACWALVGIQIALFKPAFINPDTYQYLAIANYYLETPGWHIRDAHTVGPVIPALLAGLKWVVLRFTSWTPDVDVAIVKCAAIACYMVVTLSAVMYHARRGLSAAGTAFVVGVMVFTLPVEVDTVSLNGELVCVAWLALMFVVAANPTPRPRDDAIVVALALLIIYTKMQAVLMIGAAFCTCFHGRRRLRVILAFAACFLAVDLTLWLHDAGWIAGTAHMTRYIRDGHAGATFPIGSLKWLYSSIARPISHLQWVSETTFSLFPVAATAVVAALAVPMQKEARQSLILWLLVFLASVIIPGRPFTHYVLCLIPVAFLFSDVVFRRGDWTSPTGRTCIAVLVGLAVIKLCVLLPDARSFKRDAFLRIIPRQFITPESKFVRDNFRIPREETMFVHGWDYRYYSYFNKGSFGPELAFVQLGAETPDDYLRELLEAKPTFIFDVVNHSGLVADPGYALAANPGWNQRISAAYDRVFAQNGLVIYRRRLAGPRPH